jgi:hypothetical protein
VHGRYSRAEIEAAHCFSSNDSLTQKPCGYGVLTADAPWMPRLPGISQKQAT